MPVLHVADHATPGQEATATTACIQDLIDRVGREGGMVVISPGVWEVTTLALRSNMTLRVERGAVLLAHPDLSEYPVHVLDPTNHDRQPYHTLLAEDCENLTIEGDGILDGQGEKFWDPPLGDRTQGAVGLFWRHRGKRVSPMLEFKRCQNLVLRDITIRNSPGWTVHMLSVRKARISGITIRNHLFGPNTDGLDINGCTDLFISDCDLSCGDDAIILKAFPDAGNCERIAIDNCILESNCAAIGFGAETSADIRDVSVSNCVVKAALRMIQFEMWDPGIIENITITNISGRTMTPVPLERPIYLDIQHHGRTDGKLGKMRNVIISNFTAETRGRIVLTAADGTEIENVTLRDIHLRYPEIEDPEFTVNRMRSSQMSNSNPETRDQRAAVVMDNVRGVDLINVHVTWPSADPPLGEVTDAAWPGIHRQLPMKALLCRNVRDAIIDCPHLTPSPAESQALDSRNSELTIRALGPR